MNRNDVVKMNWPELRLAVAEKVFGWKQTPSLDPKYGSTHWTDKFGTHVCYGLDSYFRPEKNWNQMKWVLEVAALRGWMVEIWSTYQRSENGLVRPLYRAGFRRPGASQSLPMVEGDDLPGVVCRAVVMAALEREEITVEMER